MSIFSRRGEIERLFGRLSHCLRRNPKNFIKPKKRCIVRGRTIALGVGTLLTCGQLRFATASCRAGTGRDSPTSRLLEKTIEDTSGQSEFDIWLFLKFLRPDLFLILLSVVVSIYFSLFTGSRHFHKTRNNILLFIISFSLFFSLLIFGRSYLHLIMS